MAIFHFQPILGTSSARNITITAIVYCSSKRRTSWQVRHIIAIIKDSSVNSSCVFNAKLSDSLRVYIIDATKTSNCISHSGWVADFFNTGNFPILNCVAICSAVRGDTLVVV